MAQVALFDKNWFNEDTVSQMTRDTAISTVLHNNGVACIRDKAEVEADKARHPEKYSCIIIKDI
jgi:hypothetical protein